MHTFLSDDCSFLHHFEGVNLISLFVSGPPNLAETSLTQQSLKLKVTNFHEGGR